ncbi:MAG: cytochrome c-type biogenesis protein CcmH [Thermoleophilia bacterium]|mgnify:CR=1 FL=1
MPRRVIAALLAALALLVAVTPVVAAGGRVNVIELEKELRCVTCGTTLDVSSAPSALQIKAYIREKADAGWTKQQIIDALVAQFGREILATPPKHGFDLVAWVVPALLVAAGLAAIPFITRRWAKRHAAAPVEGSDATPDELARLQDELNRIDR